MKKNIAIIPARSGSKGLIDKNIKELCGQPMLYWTVQAAVKSGVFDEVMVSTDSQRYSEIALECGANVPFLRDSSLADDSADSISVVIDCLDTYKRNGQEFDYMCLLQPTSPLRDSGHISDSYKMLKARNAETIVSLCEVDHPPEWQNILEPTHSLEHFIDVDKLGGRQGYLTHYRLNGAIYWSSVKSLYKFRRFVSVPSSFGYVMNKRLSIDVDDELDFIVASILMER